ncbi:OmpA family protein [Umezawaea tangerina]|uniref:Outer membrane protein OmpA-like peptidoglycan-associated protein n=1 Tax=Umezawaea tangerina TaxID=84725 RepID=A0A2T0TCQ1_9PSEU|nr:OmpA family protein [Umezawaea tangerina]PRY43440.1 outer membrane protein OmpA-like peptidoglycan-associated protein [Umezawaea tangerina]
MTEDEFDEVVKKRHRNFVSDLDVAIRAPFDPVAVPAARSAEHDVIPRARTKVVAGRQARARFKTAAALAGLVPALVVVLLSQVSLVPLAERSIDCVAPRCPVSSTSSLVVSTPSSATRSLAPVNGAPPVAIPRLARADGTEMTPTPLKTPRRIVHTVNFTADSVVPVEGIDEVLAEVAREASPGSEISIVGHTARSGGRQGAYLLSLRRAEFVRDRLVVLMEDHGELLVTGVGYDDVVEPGTGVNPLDRRVQLMFDSFSSQ